MQDIREMSVENMSYAKRVVKRPKIATLTLKPIVCTRPNCSQITLSFSCFVFFFFFKGP